ncbi:MAG: DUF72 domain-containing protein [Planctomycetota bacterium]
MFEGDPGLRIGTSSWSTRDWVGGFYPPGTPPHRYIEHYSTVFDTVEIDATFYRMPTERNVDAWRRRTPDGFLFAAKTPRIITHEKILSGAGEEMTQFLETMARLEGRLGPILLQFPYFNKRAFPSEGPFLERLDRFLDDLPGGFRYAVEVRNRAWLGRELEAVCARHGAALAWIDQAWMPRPAEWRRRLGDPTAEFAYIRWLGDHRGIEKITTTWEKTVTDRKPEIAEWVPIIRELRAEGIDVFGFFNNHFAGNAPQTIEWFRELWKQSS